MPEEWRVTEPNDPKITVMRLAAQGKYDEALKLASAGRMKAEFERIAIESGNWVAYLKGTTQSSVIPASGLQSKMKSWALAMRIMTNRKQINCGRKSRKLRTTGPKRGHATLALIMDDPVYFEEVVGTLNEVDAFNALYYTGRVKDAFRKVGLNELTPAALGEWLKSRSNLFDRSDNGDPTMVNRDLLEMCSIAFHNLGVPGLEEMFDKAWMEFVATKVSGDGPGAMMPMLEKLGQV